MTVATANNTEIGTIFLTIRGNDPAFCGGSNKWSHEEAMCRDAETPKQWSIVTNKGKRKFMAWRTNLLYKINVIEHEVHARMASNAADGWDRGEFFCESSGAGDDDVFSGASAFGSSVRVDSEDFMFFFLF